MKTSVKNKRSVKLFLCFLFTIGLMGYHQLQEVRAESSGIDLLDDDFYDEDYELLDEVESEGVISDPLEPMNRVLFEINDTLYVWVFKPVINGYTYVMPWDVRYMFGNFFDNLSSPVRLVNNLLQGEFKDAGAVASRFVVNTTMGCFGFGDPAGREFDMDKRPADFGQTLGKWGVGEGVYFFWPVFGPSNMRDTAGFFGDVYVHPLEFAEIGLVGSAAYYSGWRVNSMSLEPDVYEEVKRVAVDPYIAIRQAYVDYRRGFIGGGNTELEQ